ncbi:MAG: leucine-rich repeat domain-containing protein [Candidatus Kariarchaeaceae archaeon]|jgi:hypothetical protein
MSEEALLQLCEILGLDPTTPRLAQRDEFGIQGLALNLERYVGTLPEDLFAEFTSIKWLTIANYHKTEIPGRILSGMTQLLHMRLANCKITTIPPELVADCEQLDTFEVKNCKITTLPSGLFEGTPELTIVDLENNFIKTLPDDIFEGAQRLYILKLTGNQLNTFQAELINHLDDLYEVKLNNNQLTEIDETLFLQFESLVWLDLRGNTKLPEFLDKSFLRSVNEDLWRRASVLYRLSRRGSAAEVIDLITSIQNEMSRYEFAEYNSPEFLREHLTLSRVELDKVLAYLRLL